MRQLSRRHLVHGLAGGLAGVLLASSRLAFAQGSIAVDDKSVLIVVDVQNCFLPGGSLAVKDGEQVVPVINRIAQTSARETAAIGPGFAQQLIAQAPATAGGAPAVVKAGYDVGAQGEAAALQAAATRGAGWANAAGSVAGAVGGVLWSKTGDPHARVLRLPYAVHHATERSSAGAESHAVFGGPGIRNRDIQL